MTTLQTFAFNAETPLRTVLEDGQVKFVAHDVCNALGIINSRDAVGSLDENEKGVTIADTPGGKQTMVTITESGLYALIFKSRKPQAQSFRRWVTSEVLPALRQRGTYTVPPLELIPKFDLPKSFSEALRLLADSTDHCEALQATVAAQQPAVEFVEKYVSTEGTFGIRQTAKILGIAQRLFIAHCIKRGILYREGTSLQPYAEHLQRGYFTVRTGEANEHAYAQTRFTPKGLEWARHHFAPRQDTPPRHPAHRLALRPSLTMNLPSVEPRIAILTALRDTHQINQGDDDRLIRATRTGYKIAVMHVCCAIEITAQPGEICNTGLQSYQLTDEHPVGEHHAATLRYFGLII